jgi:hypothetical protein
MLLEPDQKTVFVRWLEQQISTSKGIEEQMKLANMPEMILKRERTERAACEIVLRMITSGESTTIG